MQALRSGTTQRAFPLAIEPFGGGHPDGVGDLLDLGLQADHVRGYLAKADAGGDYRRRVLAGLEFATLIIPRVYSGIRTVSANLSSRSR